MPLRLEDLIETFSPQSTWTKRCIYEALRTAYEPCLAEGGAPYPIVLVFWVSLITGDWNSSVGEILPRARGDRRPLTTCLSRVFSQSHRGM